MKIGNFSWFNANQNNGSTSKQQKDGNSYSAFNSCEGQNGFFSSFTKQFCLPSWDQLFSKNQHCGSDSQSGCHEQPGHEQPGCHDDHPTPCPNPKPTPTPTPCPTPTPTPCPTPTPTPCPTPTPTPCPTPTPTPCPPPANNKVWGSLNISGDPTIRVTTPGVNVSPENFNPTPGVPFNVLSDPDGNFKMDVTTHTINPQGKTGIEHVDFSLTGQQVQFANDGSLIVNGQTVGNLKNGIAPVDLGNGVSVKTAQMDDGNGKTATRLVFDSPEYEVTAALRQPTGCSAYYDVNLAERTAGSADNATGATIPGQSNKISDLLKKEPQ